MSLDASLDESALPSYTDAELEQYVARCPFMTTTRLETVRVLSPRLVAKSIPYLIDPQDEVLAIERARSAGVNVPAVHRVIPTEDKCYLIIMEYVHGKTLEQLWESISLFTVLRLARQLRAYLSAMASVTSLTTGGLHSGRVRSEWLRGIFGPIPHASPTTFTNYLNWWLTECQPAVFRPRTDLVLRPPSHHILVHQDLAPRNMILDPKGRLWLIDWGHAGFYPSYMEYGCMEARGSAMPWLGESTWIARWGRLKWSLFRLAACGFGWRHRKQLRALAEVCLRSSTFKLSKGPYSSDDDDDDGF
ncbi:kinase-like protein [Schizophyllum commune Tattone D]|nr:kinase-like protein [Schizophyllum commune Tattone D]